MTLDLESPRLAVNGGSPVRTKPFLDNFTFGEEEKRAAVRAVEAGYLSRFEGSLAPAPNFSFRGGPFVRALEKRWAGFYGVRHAVSMNSATSCLYAAAGALGLGYGDEVIVSPSTMTASAVAPLLYGAIPVFADIERRTGSLDPASIERLITPRTRAVIVVHQYGIPADMDRIMALTAPRGIRIIEDCAQAHAARYKGRLVGTFGEIGVFSLNANKAIHCGEGGLCTVNDDELKLRLELIRNHAENAAGPAGAADLLNLIGFNFRMTEVCAAVAIEQMPRLGRINETRRSYAAFLNSELRGIDFLEPVEGREGCESVYYTYPILYNPEIAGRPLAQFRAALSAEGVLFLPGYEPLYHQPLYRTKTLFKGGYPFSAPENRAIRTNYEDGSCPVAESLAGGLLINEYVRLPNTMEDMADIAAAVKKVAGR